MIKATINRFEGNYAILILNDKQRLNWPKKDLPHNISEGSVVWLSILANEKTIANQRQLAKEMLNEILKRNQR